MRRVMRKVAAGSLAAAGLAAVAGCGSDGNGAREPASTPTVSAPASVSAPAAATTPPTAPTTPAAPATPTAVPSQASAVRKLIIDVKGGKATGDTGLVRLRVNEPFQVVVTSDVTDEVHVHSNTRAGFSGAVEAGGTVTVDAIQKVPGRYEVELEERGLGLARLQVS